MIERLSVDQVVRFNEMECARTEENSVLLDRGGLEAAIERPWGGSGDDEFFPTLYDKAAALLHGIAARQVFENGNKRTAWLAAATLLDINGTDIGGAETVQSDMFVRAAALDHTLEISDLAEWFEVSHKATMTASIAPSRAIAGAIFTGVPIRIRDVVPTSQPAILESVTFRDCDIIGPGVLVLMSGSSFVGNSLSSESLWELDPMRAYEGGIGVLDCSFERCQFIGVGIAGPREVIDSFFS